MATAAEQQRAEQRRRDAALAAGGALAIGTVGGVPDAGKLPDLAKRNAVAALILGQLVAFLAEQTATSTAWLRDALGKRANLPAGSTPPTAGRGVSSAPGLAGDVDRVIAEEARREAAFTRGQTERFARDIGTAIAHPDAAARTAAVRALTAREEVYARQRTEAMAARAFAAVDRVVLRQDSPAGAFWKLDPAVAEHTAGCLLMGGKFWPWRVLDRLHPPRHPGCPCRLVSYGEAIADGLMRPSDVMDVNAAVQRAAHVVMEAAILPHDDVDALRDLLFEASDITAGQALVVAGLAEQAAVNAAHEALELGVPKPDGLKEHFDGVGLGLDYDGWFVYSHAARSPSFASATQITAEAVMTVRGEG